MWLGVNLPEVQKRRDGSVRAKTLRNSAFMPARPGISFAGGQVNLPAWPGPQRQAGTIEPKAGAPATVATYVHLVQI